MILSGSPSNSAFNIEAHDGATGTSADTNQGELGLYYNDGTTLTDEAVIKFYRGSGAGDGYFGFNTGSTEKLRIKSDGNIVIPSSTNGGRLGIGIGLDGTPSAKLDIANDSATGQLHIKHGWASRRFFSISIINNEARWYKIVNYQAGNMLVGSLQIYTSRGGGFNQTKGYNEWKVSYGGFSDSIYGTAAENTSFQSGTGNSVDLVKGDSPENIYIKVPGSIYSGSVYFIFEGIAANWQLDTDTYLTSAP